MIMGDPRGPRPLLRDDDGGQCGRLLLRGRALLAGGGIDEAIEVFGRAARLAPAWPDVHCDLARALRAAGRTESARAAYRRALDLDETHRTALNGLRTLPPEPPGRANFAVGQRLHSARDGTWTVREVKQGGFGVVYLVERAGGAGMRAVKTFDARLLWSDEDRHRFEREAATWLALDPHPHVVTAHWLEHLEGFPCLVMDHAAGGDLGGRLRAGPLEPRDALRLGLQFCDGMRHAHDQLGIVHRDIKPANCLLTGDGRLLIADFGLARVFGRQDGPGAPTDGPHTTLIGTPRYMAPEQFVHGARLDTRTDVYAFGVLLLTMLGAGCPPPAKAARYLEESGCARELPPDLARLIADCVRPDPADRPSGFGEVRERLREAHGATVGTLPRRPPPRERTVRAGLGRQEPRLPQPRRSRAGRRLCGAGPAHRVRRRAGDGGAPVAGPRAGPARPRPVRGRRRELRPRTAAQPG
ncbi:protein kinase [Prauserella oleivorans]